MSGTSNAPRGTRRAAPVRETDAYIAPASGPRDEEVSIKPWVRNVLQPLLTGAMVTCIAISIVQFIQTLNPGWNGLQLILMPLPAAMAGHYTYRSAHKRYMSGIELFRFQLVELLIILLVIKLVGYMDNTFPEILADIRTWPKNWLAFFDGQTLVAFLLASASWYTTWATASDLEELADPAMYDTRSFTQPTDRIRRRFFIGGFILLFFSGLTRSSIIELLQLERPRLPKLAFNALLYFVGGLVILSQLRFTRLARIWRTRETRFSSALSAHWAQYSLILLGVVLIFAFLLPTSYTIGFLDLVNFIITIITYILSILYLLLITPLVFLISLFTQQTSVSTPAPLSRPAMPGPQSMGVEQPAAMPFMDILRSVLFWAIAIGAIYYITRSYLRDRPELWASIQRFRPVQLMLNGLRALRRWLRSMRRGITTQIAEIAERLGSARRAPSQASASRKSGKSLREQVYYYYLSTLDHAQAQGVARRLSQTPYEYYEVLNAKLPAAQDEMGELTEAFIEARYSQHPLQSVQLSKLKIDAARVRDALRTASETQEKEKEDEKKDTV